MDIFNYLILLYFYFGIALALSIANKVILRDIPMKAIENKKKVIRNHSPLTIRSVITVGYLLCTSVLTVEARDSYLPYIESLDVEQKRAYVQAAPNGNDEPLSVPVEIHVANTAIEPEVNSLLEQRAGEKKGLLTLEGTQQSQVLASDLEQFGYDIFKRPTSPFSAIQVPVNYRIGPGDNIIVQLFGKRNVEYKLVVTRDGDILVPEYGPMKVAGLTFDDVEKLIVEGFEKRVIGAKAVVTMGKLRTIQIRLAGDAAQPGIHTIGGLSSLTDALLMTGGVKHTGSLRKIELIRHGKRVARLDLYDLLQRGLSFNQFYLAHNDTIFVPPIGDIIYVAGEVQRPAIYELKHEKTVGQIIDMAGGLLPTASLEHSLIERIQDTGTRTLVDFSASRGSRKNIKRTPIRNGDFLRILPLEDDLEDVIMLSGHVKRPGGYQFHAGMTLSDVLSSVDTMLPGADIDFMLIKRDQENTLRTEVVYASPFDFMAKPDSDKDIVLKARDQLYVFNLGHDREQAVANIVKELEVQSSDKRPARVVEVRGAVRYNGKFPLQVGAHLLDVVTLSGGLRTGTELFYGVVARPQYPSRDIQILSFSLSAAMNNPLSKNNLEIFPGDRLYFFDENSSRSELLSSEIEQLKKQASYGADEKLVTVFGQVLHPGSYPLEPGMRASDLLCAARGLSRKANGLGAELSRVLHHVDTDNQVEHISLDSVALLDLCDLGRRAEGGYLTPSQHEQLKDRYGDNRFNPLLKPMDQLSFSEKSGWVERATVTLSGEFKHPGVYAIDRGETLCQVIKRAGGLTGDAYSFGAKFTRKSVREMQQQTLDELHDELDDLMVDLSLSHSFNNEEKTSLENAGKQDYLKTIRQLERAKASGRMVIDLEKILTCNKRSDLIVMDGDAIDVPQMPNFVQVAGQVYVPTSHLYDEGRKIADYVELSGGHTVLGRLKDTYVVQANGEVLNYKNSRRSSRILYATVMPGAKIYVPINVDRMNGTEKAQSWVSSVFKSALLLGLAL